MPMVSIYQAIPQNFHDAMNCKSERPAMNEWQRILPYVTADIQKEGLDIDPVKLPEYMAKSITLETTGNRGFIFYGGVGSGKTRRLQFLSNVTGIKMLNAREMCAEWVDCGGNDSYFQSYCLADGLSYSVLPRYYHDLIIDDIGTEATTYSCYGTMVDVMRDIIIPFRYAQFPRWRTFFTTNLKEKQLEDRYGSRVYSRLNEMCAFIPLKSGDRRMGGRR